MNIDATSNARITENSAVMPTTECGTPSGRRSRSSCGEALLSSLTGLCGSWPTSGGRMMEWIVAMPLHRGPAAEDRSVDGEQISAPSTLAMIPGPSPAAYQPNARRACRRRTSRDTEQDRDDDAPRIFARHDELGERTDDGADNNREKNRHDLFLVGGCGYFRRVFPAMSEVLVAVVRASHEEYEHVACHTRGRGTGAPSRNPSGSCDRCEHDLVEPHLEQIELFDVVDVMSCAL